MSAYEGSAMQYAQQQQASSAAMRQYAGVQSASTAPRPLLELRNEMQARFRIVSEQAQTLAKKLGELEQEREALSLMLKSDLPSYPPIDTGDGGR